jgi:hypothetical protein
LRDLAVAERRPDLKDFLGGFHLVERVGLIEIFGQVVIRKVTLLLELGECERYESQIVDYLTILSSEGELASVE